MKYKILHVGPEDKATTLHRYNALIDLGHSVKRIYTIRLSEQPSYSGKRELSLKRIRRFLSRKAGYPIQSNSENQQILYKIKIEQPDLIFIEKGLTIWPKTLTDIKKKYPSIKIISFSLDDMKNKMHQSKYYLKSLKLYDIHFTNKRYNVNELINMGAKKVYYLSNAYSKSVHKPIKISEKDKLKYGCDISFVGGYELERFEMMYYLAENGIRVRVWGNNWHKCKIFHKNLLIENKPAYGDLYGKVICSSKIVLAFLRKINRDEETTRSVEIPAFNAFMLAERSSLHQEMFLEGKEAAFFNKKEELLEKIIYYLNNDSLRKKIADLGYKKCMSLNCSQHDKMSDLLKICFENEKD